MKQAISFTFLILALLTFLLFCFFYTAGWRFNTVMTGSMEPTIDRGALVVTKPLQISNGIVNKIILFDPKNYDGTILHRVKKEHIEKDGTLVFTTKGDANLVTDRVVVYPNEVKGVYVFHVPYLGYTAEFVQKHLVWISILLLVLLFVCVKKKSRL
ncbi:signal peptidase I [Priestia koreensis]|uniref:signal peptidase I n=1 Tax=Priestia koreensis TaxID=284581 RepID=UPI00203F0900|nr:signal peptidase I [Priestia koreensis]MCM3003100.1 signal peptidase I [Priestia koreensis]